MVSLNLHRRHLSESQRAMVAAKLANLDNGQRASPIGEGAVTQQSAADMLNVGKRTVERAREVIEGGAPELVAAVESGAVSVSAAADVASLSKPEQAEIVARGEREILQAAKQIRSAKAEERQIELRRMRDARPALPDGRPAVLRRWHTLFWGLTADTMS